MALTGATGFLGRHLVPFLHAQGHKVRILTRRDPAFAEWRGIELEAVPGDLDDERALQRLVAGADVVIHAAGLIKARHEEDFFAVNREGARHLAIITAREAPRAGFVLISSLVAREPDLSPYTASKRAGEMAVSEILPSGQLTIVRPPAIYGPADAETRTLFRLATSRLVPLATPAEARLALIHVTDAARAIVAFASAAADGFTGRWTICDPHPEGYTLREVLRTAAHALGKHPHFVQLPPAALQTLGLLGESWAALSGRAVMLTQAKTRELRHNDWSVGENELPPPNLWKPRISMAEGIAKTALWYRAHGQI
ncbi:MAG: NAD-dependent epimerase/dehydratase family protein [Parvibaculaceae bacterium]|nr:NAD-dependent epimerase/dehydratase family protein [Parvibaculaceae bacterium]